MTDDDAGALLELYLDEAIAAYMADDFDAWAEAAKLAIEVNAAIRGARRHRVTGSRAGVALDHIDGNPLNNDPANLRAVQISDNRRRKP